MRGRCAGRFDTLFRGQEKAVASGFVSNSLEFEGIEIGVIGLLPRRENLVPDPGALYVMDRGLHRFHQADAFFVIRARSNTWISPDSLGRFVKDRWVPCSHSLESSQHALSALNRLLGRDIQRSKKA